MSQSILGLENIKAPQVNTENDYNTFMFMSFSTVLWIRCEIIYEILSVIGQGDKK